MRTREKVFLGFAFFCAKHRKRQTLNQFLNFKDRCVNSYGKVWMAEDFDQLPEEILDIFNDKHEK